MVRQGQPFLCFRDRQMALHVYVCQISGRRTRMGGRGDFVRLRTENRLAENENRLPQIEKSISVD